MSRNIFTLEALEEELERSFAPLVFRVGDEEFVLQNLIRVNKKDREAVQETLARMDLENAADLDEDELVAAMHQLLKAVCKDGKGEKLVKLLGDDIAKLQVLLDKWAKATQPGEAEPSPA